MTAVLESPLEQAAPAPAPDRADGRAVNRHRGLDGVRGLALAVVIAFHAGWLQGGFVGVDVFFALSGYLITRQLVRMSACKGARSVGAFWARRIRRLGPAAVVLLAATYVWLRMGAPLSAQGTVRGQLQAALAWVSNWYSVVHDLGYWQDSATHTPLGHLWSLAVEEQFYVVWPLVLLGLLALARGVVSRWLIAVVVVLSMASLGWQLVCFASQGADRAYFGSDTRVGPLLAGSALALAFARWPRRDVASPRLVRASGWVLAPLAAVVIAVGCVSWSTEGGRYFVGGLAAVTVASTVLIALVEFDAVGPFRWALGRGLLPWLGQRSYSLYLWTWPAQLLIDERMTGLHGPALAALRLVAGIGAGLLCYVLIERPIHESRLQGPSTLLLVGIPLAVLAVAVHRWVPAVPPEFGTQTITSHATAPGDGLRVLIVGDSWARNLGRSLVDLDGGKDTIFNDGVGGCGIADGTALKTEFGIKGVDPICATWPTRWAHDVVVAQPDVVVLETGNWDQVPVRLNGEFRKPGDPAFDAHYSAQLDRAVTTLSARGAVVYVMTVRDNPKDQGLSAAMNDMLRAVVTRHPERARLLDLRSQICDSAGHCPSRINGIGIYDNTGHLTSVAQRRVTTWVLDTLRAEVKPLRGISDAKALRPSTQLDKLIGAAPTLDGSGVAVRTSIQADLPMSPVIELERSLDAGALRYPDGSYAALARFDDDLAPDRYAIPALEGLRAQGWHEYANNTFAMHVFSRGERTIGILRITKRLVVVRVNSGRDSEAAVARYLLALAAR